MKCDRSGVVPFFGESQSRSLPRSLLVAARARVGTFMLFVHKRSQNPIDPWSALRHGGMNNLDNAAVRSRYLVLWNVDIVQREGAWHYLFEFDGRDRLELGALAQLVGKAQRYPDDMDWKQWLGPEYHVISASVREEILRMPAAEARTGAIITEMREVPPEEPGARPIPGRDAEHWFQLELPADFVFGLPDTP
jgi:hypothetical protein